MYLRACWIYLNTGLSINDVMYFLIFFTHPFPHRQAFKYKGFRTVVSKSPCPPPPKALTSFINAPYFQNLILILSKLTSTSLDLLPPSLPIFNSKSKIASWHNFSLARVEEQYVQFVYQQKKIFFQRFFETLIFNVLAYISWSCIYFLHRQTFKI